MKRGALDTEVVMFVNDLRERCGSGRLGSSCHVIGIIDEIHKKVGKGFAGNSVKLAQCRADILHGSPRADSMMARERMLPQTGRMYACNRPVRLMKRNFAALLGGESWGEFQSIFSETLTRSEKTIYAG
jgi:hypothetical protein